jgi:hypothetical protein
VSATDTRGNTYTVDVDRTQALVRTVILSANIQTPLQAGDTVTISHPDSKAQAVSVYRVAGLAGATRVAETASNGGSSNSLSVTVTTGGQRFLFAAATQKDNGMPVTQPSGWTNLNTRYVSCAGKALTDVGAFRIADAGTWIYTATSTRSDSWSAGLVGYRAP